LALIALIPTQKDAAMMQIDMLAGTLAAAKAAYGA
jgi:hypothetical protein